MALTLFGGKRFRVLKMCSQRVSLLRVLREQGLSRGQLHTVFLALTVSQLRYALPAGSGFLSREQIGQIDAFLRRIYRFGFSCELSSQRSSSF